MKVVLTAISRIYNRYILGRPALVLAGLALVCLAAAWFARDFELDASADSLLLEGDESLRVFRESVARFGTQDFLFVTFTPEGDLFSDRSLEAIDSLADELRKLPRVDSVNSLVDVPLVRQAEGGLSDLAENYKTLSDPDVDRGAARRELLESPIYSDLIISDDAMTTALQVNLKTHPEFVEVTTRRGELLLKANREGLTPAEQAELEQVEARYEVLKDEVDAANHANIERIRAIIADYGRYGTLHLGGLTMIADDMITFIKNDLIVFGLGVFTFLVLMLSILFRRARWVVLPLASCAVAGLVMLGILGFAGWEVTVISSNFISLMLILTMSMNVHLIVRYRQLRRDYPERSHEELVLETARRMVWPCLYTALTTMIGFGSLVVSNIKPVIDFGWMMSLGLVVTFLVSFLFFPTLLMTLGKTSTSRLQSETTPFTAVLARATERFGKFILLAAVVLGVLSVVGMTRLKVENSFVSYFSEDTEIYQGLSLIDRKLGGTTPLDVVLKFDPEEEYGEDAGGVMDDLAELFGTIESDPAEGWFTSYKIDQIRAVHDYLENQPEIGKVLSLASVIEMAEELNEGESFDAFELAVIYKRIPEDLKKSIIDPYISIEDNQARISTRVMDTLPDLRRNELLRRIRSDLESKFDLAQDDYQLTGLLVLYNNMLQSLFDSQIKTLGVVLAGIALMLLVLFRSVLLAVIGIIPNILAAGMILGLMGILGIPLDMMTITIAAITMGIAVDNSIHYIYRFQEEFPRQGRDYLATLYYCHANIGRSVFYTAVTIIAGFSILVFSNFIPTIYFGILTALAMLIALLAALTLLPRLILLFRPFA